MEAGSVFEPTSDQPVKRGVTVTPPGTGARVSKKLSTEEKLISSYSGVRVKMDIDRYDLWSDTGDVSVGALWDIHARYPHMPRLATYDVLASAISDGTSNLNWPSETFGYADARDGDTWVGVRTGQHVNPSGAGADGTTGPVEQIKTEFYAQFE